MQEPRHKVIGVINPFHRWLEILSLLLEVQSWNLEYCLEGMWGGMIAFVIREGSVLICCVKLGSIVLHCVTVTDSLFLMLSDLGANICEKDRTYEMCSSNSRSLDVKFKSLVSACVWGAWKENPGYQCWAPCYIGRLSTCQSKVYIIRVRLICLRPFLLSVQTSASLLEDFAVRW